MRRGVGRKLSTRCATSLPEILNQAFKIVHPLLNDRWYRGWKNRDARVLTDSLAQKRGVGGGT